MKLKSILNSKSKHMKTKNIKNKEGNKWKNLNVPLCFWFNLTLALPEEKIWLKDVCIIL